MFLSSLLGGILGILFFTFFGMRMIPDTGYIPEFAKAEKKELKKSKATIACITMFGVIVVIALSPAKMPMHMASVSGALIFVGSRCMSLQDAVK